MKYTGDQITARRTTLKLDKQGDLFHELLRLDVEHCPREYVHMRIDEVIDAMVRSRARALRLFPGVERDLYPETDVVAT